MVYRRKGREVWWVKIPDRHGRWVDRSTGTRDTATGKAMETMIRGFRDKRDWHFLDWVADNTISLPQLYDAHATNDLDGLKARLEARDADTDLRPFVMRWRKWLEGQLRPAGVEEYRTKLATLMPRDGPWWLSTVTLDTVDMWLAGLDVGGSTKRKYAAALSSLFNYLQSIGKVKASPLEGLKLPKANPPQCVFLDLPDVKQLVEASTEPYRSLFALIYGTGCDVSVAVNLRTRDVCADSREIRARGTKEYNRDRIVRVADWAWPYVRGLLTGKLPAAELFPTLDRTTATKAHLKIARALELHQKGITLRAARHHWAVRAIRAGTPAELVGRQLGHKDATMVLKVYGRFVPRSADRDKWERLATAMDKEQARSASRGA